MNRTWGLVGGLSRRRFLALSAAAAAGAVGLSGCKTDDQNKLAPQTRSQIGEDPADRSTVTTIGSKTTVSNVEPIIVSGVGLVYNLPGTGSSPPPNGWRSMLEDYLRKVKRDQDINIKALLDSPDRSTSLVLVSAVIPPGARRDEPVDVQVTLPTDSKTTSLHGGILFSCELYNSDTTGNIQSGVRTGQRSAPSGATVLGSVWVKAHGPLVAGNFEADGLAATPELDSDGRPMFRAGMVWGGGKVTMSRPYHLLLNPGDQNPSVAAAVAERLNSTFHSTADARVKVAEAKDRELIVVNVPTGYKHNHYRFLLATRQVPYSPVGPDSPYLQKLKSELMEPGTALTAAVKLEALGAEGRHALKIGLESPSPWVRFAAAEALAYLGQTDGAGELARLAEDHPALRAHCLLALASLDDGTGTDRLVDMLAHADPELRFGAFVALKLADRHHPALNGKPLARSYTLYRLAPSGTPAVHLSPAGRNEIVVFGDAVKFRGPMRPLAVGTEYTVSVPESAEFARVTRIVKGQDGSEVKELRCSPDVAGVLECMARFGGGFTEAVELLRVLAKADALAGPVVFDSLPRQFSIHQLSGFAKTDPTLGTANKEVAKIGTQRQELDAVGFELPTGQDAGVTPAGAPLVRPPLNRDPGRIFGPKRAPDTPILDPVVVPAGGQ